MGWVLPEALEPSQSPKITPIKERPMSLDAWVNQQERIRGNQPPNAHTPPTRIHITMGEEGWEGGNGAVRGLGEGPGGSARYDPVGVVGVGVRERGHP